MSGQLRAEVPSLHDTSERFECHERGVLGGRHHDAERLQPHARVTVCTTALVDGLTMLIVALPFVRHQIRPSAARASVRRDADGDFREALPWSTNRTPTPSRCPDSRSQAVGTAAGIRAPAGCCWTSVTPTHYLRQPAQSPGGERVAARAPVRHADGQVHGVDADRREVCDVGARGRSGRHRCRRRRTTVKVDAPLALSVGT